MLANCVSFFLSGFMNLLASAIYAKEVMIEWQGKISFRDPKNCTVFKLKIYGPTK